LADDTWVLDPQVKYMRRVFAGMETAGNKLTTAAGIAPFDERLRRFRQIALAVFEKAWPIAIGKGVAADEEGAAGLYARCLAGVLSAKGIVLPAASLPTNEAIESILQETLR
jgi:hypothetical protein